MSHFIIATACISLIPLVLLPFIRAVRPRSLAQHSEPRTLLLWTAKHHSLLSTYIHTCTSPSRSHVLVIVNVHLIWFRKWKWIEQCYWLMFILPNWNDPFFNCDSNNEGRSEGAREREMTSASNSCGSENTFLMFTSNKTVNQNSKQSLRNRSRQGSQLHSIELLNLQVVAKFNHRHKPTNDRSRKHMLSRAWVCLWPSWFSCVHYVRFLLICVV